MNTPNLSYRSSGLCALTGIFLLYACLAAPTASAEAKRYEIDPEHFSIGFLVEHIGYSKVLGMFRKGSGAFTFDETTGELSDVVVTIDSESVFSNHRKRDEHLRSADFLNSAEFPQIVFRASRATPTEGRRYRIQGELELLGQSRPLTLEATWNKSGEYPFGGGVFGGKPYVMGVSARASFKRSAYGMTYSVDNGWVGDTVELIFEFEARRQ
jgi:polyisoprenoid-binding protein YceI